ncbi:hypothetical protein [Methylocystis suflitae]|uniref:hypothetical protein n=1 Tax=Methylocystis suflitae TaxID=2951405 RepID=UPI00210A466F|nr:hypothetical protein [Methylocystis suflitae]MCQ4188503.1 hypothetical protein [Methylocystis suflitae]
MLICQGEYEAEDRAAARTAWLLSHLPRTSVSAAGRRLSMKRNIVDKDQIGTQYHAVSVAFLETTK